MVKIQTGWTCRNFQHHSPLVVTKRTVNTGNAIKSKVPTLKYHSHRAVSGTAVPRTKCSKWQVKPRKPKYAEMATLETMNFDNLALRVLPIDPEEENYIRQVSGACFSKVKPTPVEKPETVAYAANAMQVSIDTKICAALALNYVVFSMCRATGLISFTLFNAFCIAFSSWICQNRNVSGQISRSTSVVTSTSLDQTQQHIATVGISLAALLVSLEMVLPCRSLVLVVATVVKWTCSMVHS